MIENSRKKKFRILLYSSCYSPIARRLLKSTPPLLSSMATLAREHMYILLMNEYRSLFPNDPSYSDILDTLQELSNELADDSRAVGDVLLVIGCPVLGLLFR